MNELSEAIEAVIESKLSELNTGMPAVVISYDPARNRAVVRPSLPKALADGSTLESPTIAEVPVMWPSSGVSAMTWPLPAGSQVWLDFGQRSLDGWLSGNDAPPDDPRRFDLTDAVARPGGGRDIQGVDPDNTVFRNGATSLVLQADGTAVLNGNLIVNGNINATGDIVAQIISLLLHRHNETGSITGASRT